MSFFLFIKNNFRLIGFLQIIMLILSLCLSSEITLLLNNNKPLFILAENASLGQFSSKNFLINCGLEAETTLTALGQNLSFFDKNIDLLIITKESPLLCLPVFDRYNVRQVYFSQFPSNTFQQILRDKKIPFFMNPNLSYSYLKAIFS